MLKLTQSLLLVILLTGMAAARPVIHQVTVSSDTVGLYEKLEIVLDFAASFTNPYDFEQVNLRAEFTSPSSKHYLVDGFYYQDFKVYGTNGTLIPNGLPNWRIRFAPTEAGVWNFTIYITDVSGTINFAGPTFICIASANAGFIRRLDDRYLRFDGGKQFISIGENIGWYGSKTIFDYKDWMTKLSANGGNYMRVWMCSWAMGIEWKDTGLGNYEKRQSRAYQLDWILDLARQQGIYIQLCLNNHGQVSTMVNPEWENSPYNSANGGPCEQTWHFFTNTDAKKYYRNRMRYIIARWGHAANIMAWELFNEVDLTDDFVNRRTEVHRWHEEMANYLRELDVNQHLITTSYSNHIYEPITWNLPIMDFTQVHIYREATDTESLHRELVQTYLQSFRKPMLIGEFGLEHDGNWLSANDPNGIFIHNSLWASIVSGAFGTASTWWWDNYIHPRNLYYHFKPVAEFMKSVDLQSQHFAPVIPVCHSDTRIDLALAPGFSAWAKPPQNHFTVNTDGSMQPPGTELGRYLFGSVWNAQLRNPPTFHVHYLKAGQFKVVTSDYTGTAPTIEICLDNVKVLSQPAAVNSTYAINVPEGDHQIYVDNKGTDWIEIADYVFTSYTPAIRSFALIGETEILGWIQHRNYNWKYVRDTGVPAPVQDGTITFSPIAGNGPCTVEWWYPPSGTIVRTNTGTIIGGTLSLPVPSIQWDYAFKVRYGDTQVASGNCRLPPPFALEQNFPNPFNSNTMIPYSIVKGGVVGISIYNVNGRLVRHFEAVIRSPGAYVISWDGTDVQGAALPSGIYFYRLRVDQTVSEVKRLLLLK